MSRGERVKTALAKVLVLTTASAACAILLEVVYRQLHGIPTFGSLRIARAGHARLTAFRKSRNDLLIYEPIANVRSRYSGVPNSINSHGMRDREQSVEKPSGTFRIIALGDSIVYGFGVRIEDALPKKLERTRQLANAASTPSTHSRASRSTTSRARESSMTTTSIRTPRAMSWRPTPPGAFRRVEA